MHGKDIWLESNLANWLDLLLALEKYIWLYYHWDFHLDPHLNLQILELICLSQFWARLLGCGLDLKRSDVSVVASNSHID